MGVRRHWLPAVAAVLLVALAACTGEPGEPARPGAGAVGAPGSADAPLLGAFHELLPDPAGGGVLLVNGPPEGVRSDEPLTLWRWDGSAWAAVPVAGESPPARNFFSATYDDGRNVVVLYGGDLPAAESAIVWEWDGDRWRSSGAAGPGPRVAAAMSFDSGAGGAVLHGGDDGRGRLLNDTWTWDGQEWSRWAGRGPTPTRFPGAMASAPDGGGTVLLGGHQVVDENRPPALGDTWVGDAAGWQRLPGGGAPELVVNAKALLHPTLGLLVVGGSDLEEETGDVLRWDGRRWEVLGRDLFPPRQAFGLAFDAERRVVVLTGGVVTPGSTERHQDVWEWSGDPGEPATRVADDQP
ncbi:MAG: hypothetical protein ACXWDM_01395 [Nocardioides sp.]